jgi:hypothetical protein
VPISDYGKAAKAERAKAELKSLIKELTRVEK